MEYLDLEPADPSCLACGENIEDALLSAVDRIAVLERLAAERRKIEEKWQQLKAARALEAVEHRKTSEPERLDPPPPAPKTAAARARKPGFSPDELAFFDNYAPPDDHMTPAEMHALEHPFARYRAVPGPGQPHRPEKRKRSRFAAWIGTMLGG